MIVRRGNPEPLAFGDIQDLSSEVSGHIGAYLLPVFMSASKSTEEIMISAIVSETIGILPNIPIRGRS